MLLIIGFLFTLFIYAVISILTGYNYYNYSVYFNLPSVFLVFVSLLFFLLVSKSGKIIGNYIKTSFRKKHIYTVAELTALSVALKNTRKFILYAGGFGFISGMIAILLTIDDPDAWRGDVIVSFITVMYSITTSCFVLLPTQAWAENKINTLKDET